MRGFYSIFLLAILACHITGAYLVFHSRQSDIKHDVARRISLGMTDNEVIRLSFTGGEQQKIHWTEAGKEFSFDGHMYDVIAQHRQGNTVVYSCYSDMDETSLLAWLDEIMQKNSDSHANIQDAGSLVYLPSGDIKLLPHPVLVQPRMLAFSCLYHSPCLRIFSPPPQWV